MDVARKFIHEDVTGFEAGFGPFYPPLVTSYSYYLDGVLIDTGMSRMKSAMSRMLESFRIERIILTHYHEDHSGNAAALSAIHKAPVLGHPVTVEKMKNGYPVLPYQILNSGRAEPVEMNLLPDKIETEHFELVPIHTPGHSRDHTCFIERSRGWLFSGDIYLSSKIKFFRADENMHDSIESIKKILREDFSVLFCCHNPELKCGREALTRKLSFLEDFTGQVKRLAERGLDEVEIIRSMKLKGTLPMKLITFGNLSFENMVRSALK